LVALGFAFKDADVAAEHIDGFRAARPRFVETPLWIDDIRQYARLRDRVAVPLAGAEILESPYEFESLLDGGQIDIVQPWPNRVGVTGTLEVLEMARARDREIFVGGWNATPIGVAAGVHVAAGLGGAICIEHAPQDIYGDSRIRMIAGPEIEIREGVLELPAAPGLGLELDEEYWDAILRQTGSVSLGSAASVP
jgi:L-alanine-DL-glutamate epimerase-like enolase superfamily enzyme